MDHLELIKKISAGDETAFTAFYSEFKDSAYRTAYSYLRQDEEAEEITQDVFLEIYRSAKSFSAKSAVSTWVYRITINKSLDRLRYLKAKKRFGFIFSLWDDEQTNTIENIPDPYDPAIGPEKKEALTILLSAIEKLPANQKTALILTQFELLKGKEVADIMCITEKAIEGLIQRAKANLRERLVKIYQQRGKYTK